RHPNQASKTFATWPSPAAHSARRPHKPRDRPTRQPVRLRVAEERADDQLELPHPARPGERHPQNSRLYWILPNKLAPPPFRPTLHKPAPVPADDPPFANRLPHARQRFGRAKFSALPPKAVSPESLIRPP